MGRTMTVRTKRSLYVALSVLLIAGAVVFTRGRADATSSVTPAVAANGIEVFDARLGNSVTVPTQLLSSPYQGTSVSLFSLTSGARAAGAEHQQVSYGDSGIGGLANAAGVLASGQSASWSGVQIAAVQAAIWHFTEGFEPLREDGTNSPEFLAAYDQLVAVGSQNPVGEAAPSDITLTALDSPKVAGQPVRFRAEGTSPGPWTLTANSTEVSFTAATADGCSDTPISALSGPGEFCATSTIALDAVTVTATGQTAQGSMGRVFVATGGQAVIGVTSGTETPYGSAAAAWSVNQPPVVKTYCPTHIVVPGDPAHYSLYAYDPEGEALTIQWFLDGAPIPDATGDLVRVAREEGQTLTVKVTDSSGNETTAGTDCPLTIPTTTTKPAGPTTTQPAGPTTTQPTGTTTTQPAGPTTTQPTGTTTTAPTGPTTTKPAGPTTTKPSGPTTTVPTGNVPPVVTVECRNADPDELATFLATATDPDDDEPGAITGFTWRLNGQIVDGETTDQLQLKVAAGDIVTVTATDRDGGVSAVVQAPCTPIGDNQPPTVTVECRGATMPGQSATFVANATDPNGDEIARYTWSVNDTEVTGQTGATLNVIVTEGDVVTVTATDVEGATSESVKAPCTPVVENEPPEVTLGCPPELTDGEEATFTARGTDPDGDDLTYTWFVNGRPVGDVTGNELTITWTPASKVSVQVTDSKGASSDVVSSECDDNNRPPVVTMECRGDVTPGARATFIANATDPDGDTIGFAWFVNDVRVPGISGPLLSAIVAEGDVVTVVATDARGAATAPVEAPCSPITENDAPSVTVACPGSLADGEEATFTAEGTDPDGDQLTYTWYVNGMAQLESGSEFTYTYAKGDLVSVTVTDDGGLTSAEVTADCTEDNEPPTVSVLCQGDIAPDQPATFLASGTDPEGSELSYLWLLNGRVVPGQSGPELRIVLQLGDIISVIATDEAGLDSAEVTAPCTPVTENQAPEVTLECPPTLTDGEEATFTAAGTDPDGDELTYTWFVNGEPVDGETGTTLTITYNDGDRISVRVTDARGASSDEVTAECTDENRPPTVTVECPALIVYGEPTRIAASGSDPDGDRLTYVWKRNGKVIDGATGPVLQTVVERGDTVTVTVSDGRGGFSDETSVGCLSGSRPKISVECPAKLVFGEPATFTAMVTDEDGDTVANGGIKLTWAVDGKVIDGTSGSSATLTLKQGQRVDLSAVDSTGLTNAPMDAVSCSGTIVRTPPGGNNGGTGNNNATRTPAGGSVGSGTGTTRGTGAITPQVGGATQGAGAAPGTLAVTGNALLPWVAAAATLMLLGWVFRRESARRS